VEFHSKGIHGDVTGVIFAAYPVAGIITSLALGKMSFEIDAATQIFGGIAMMGVAFIGFGLLHYSTSAVLISIFAILMRCIQGSATSFI